MATDTTTTEDSSAGRKAQKALFKQCVDLGPSALAGAALIWAVAGNVAMFELFSQINAWSQWGLLTETLLLTALGMPVVVIGVVYASWLQKTIWGTEQDHRQNALAAAGFSAILLPPTQAVMLYLGLGPIP